MTTPYVPGANSLFAAFVANFAALITTAPATYGLDAGDATTIQDSADAYAAAYALANTPATRTSVTIAAAAAQRTATTAVIRPYAQNITHNPGVTNGDKTALGLNLPTAGGTPVPPPNTVPTLSLVAAIHNQHTLSYRDQTSVTSKAKPPGVIGMEVRAIIAPTSSTTPDIALPRAIATKSPMVLSTDPADVGKVATYWSRWLTRSGPGGLAQAGDWSAPLVVGII